jgi:LPS-assembly lipoprotein
MPRTCRSLLLIAVALLAACGFHLQGRVVLPASLAAVRIEAIDPQSEFVHELRAALLASGTRLDDEGDAGDVAVLHITEDSNFDRVLSVSIHNVPTDYRLTYAVKLSVSHGAKELMPSEMHELSREYTFDETTMLAKQRERDTLVAALASELADVTMRRLATL